MWFAMVGCGVTRSEVKLSMPAASAPSEASSADRPASIRSVVDERAFEEHVTNQSTPSLGSGGAARASSDVKSRAVGRKGTVDHPLGDVLLEPGQTVAIVVGQNVAAALQKAGYRVTSNVEDAGPSPLILDVHIKQFWSWFEPGTWTVTLHAIISTTIDIEGRSDPISLTEEWSRASQTGNDSSWTEVLEGALQRYRRQLVARLTTEP